MYPFCFVTHIHDDNSYRLLQRTILTWTSFHKDVEIHVINDNYNASIIRSFSNNVHFHVGNENSRKKPPYTEWIRQYFNTFIQFSQADYMIRLDPDTMCHKAIIKIPDADMFGTHIILPSCPPHIQGGCVGFSRNLARTFITADIKPSTVKPMKIFRHYSDLVLYDIVKNQLNMNIVHWNEVCSSPMIPPQREYWQKWAFTHPHKKFP